MSLANGEKSSSHKGQRERNEPSISKKRSDARREPQRVRRPVVRVWPGGTKEDLVSDVLPSVSIGTIKRREGVVVGFWAYLAKNLTRRRGGKVR